MKSKIQKTKELEKGRALLKENKALILVDIGNIKTQALKVLKMKLRNVDGRMMVIKKRLLRILLQEQGIDFDTGSQKLILGTIFTPRLEESTADVYKFLVSEAKDKSAQKLIGGVDLVEKKFLDVSYMRVLGTLPSREVLLAQLVGTIAAPLRSFLYVLQERSKKL